MRYPNVHPATFLHRPNRFVAHVELAGREVVCHVKNTGRCRELLVPGATVYVVHSDTPGRKTAYDLVAVCKGGLLINMDAQAPNRVAREWLEAGQLRPDLTHMRAEMTYGDSRFDFYWESSDCRGFVEVKGCTLEEDGVARFPDAPTLRGVKHVNGLIDAKRAGYAAAVLLVVQMEGMRWFEPNDRTHPAFGDALRRAAEEGVQILALGCRVTPDCLTWGERIPVRL